MSRRPASRLSTLLRVRRIAEETSRARLAEAAAAELAAVEEVRRTRRVYLDGPAVDGDTELQDFLWGRSRVAARAASVHRAVFSEAAAAEQADAARCLWSEAAQRLTAIERLEERVREARRLELLAEDQHVAEEIAAARREERR